MKSAILAVCILAATTALMAQLLPVASPSEVGMSEERLSRIDEVAQEAIARADAPGAVIQVARRGKIVYRKAFGMRALEPDCEPMTLDTIFDAASLTKVVATAPSMMVLVEEGRLALSDTVVTHIPEFGQFEKDRITLLQLLTHFSGLRPDVDLDQSWTGYEEAVRRACAEKLVAVPGDRFIYSDINYLVLAEVIRRVTGQDVDQFARQKIYGPLGMNDTGFRPPSGMVSRIAPTERRDGVMMRGTVHDPTAFRCGGVAGHAGLFTTADDLAVFAQMLLNGGIFNRTRILSPLGVRAMSITQSPIDAPELRSIGFDIRSPYSSTRGDLFPVGSFGHTGFTGTSLWIDPYTETFVIVMTNRVHPKGQGNAGPMRKRIASVVAASIMELPSAPVKTN